MAESKISALVEKWMNDFERASEYELSRSEFVKEGSSWYLRVFIDKLENGGYGRVGTDDCELVSRYLSGKLDEEDPINRNYMLEVSSPGLDRPLISDKDFLRFTGEQVEISLYKPEQGSKFHTGKLLGRSEEAVVIEGEDGQEKSFARSGIAKVKLSVIF